VFSYGPLFLRALTENNLTCWSPIMLALRTLALSTALIAVAAAGSIYAAPASAQGVYAGRIKNNLGIPAAYQYQYNGGQWIMLTLAPGQIHEFSVPSRYATTTVINVRYDSRLGDGRLTLRTVRLAMHGCDRPNNGWLQCFIRVNTRDVVLAR
jgi:hypothetical protein